MFNLNRNLSLIFNALYDRCESFRGSVKVFENFLNNCLKDESDFNKKLGVEIVKNEGKIKKQKMAGLEEVQDKENVMQS